MARAARPAKTKSTKTAAKNRAKTKPTKKTKTTPMKKTAKTTPTKKSKTERKTTKASSKAATSPSATKTTGAATSAKPAPRLGPFEREGELTWAVLAPMAAGDLEARIAAMDAKRFFLQLDDDDEEPEPRHWCVLPGTRGYAAMIDTHLGNASGEEEYAAALSKELGETVYALSFGGYNDPDKGLPYIQQYVKGRAQMIWMADSFDDEYPVDASKFVAGPKGVPSTDPFEFAKAFGFDLQPYYD